MCEGHAGGRVPFQSRGADQAGPGGRRWGFPAILADARPASSFIDSARRGPGAQNMHLPFNTLKLYLNRINVRNSTRAILSG